MLAAGLGLGLFELLEHPVEGQRPVDRLLVNPLRGSTSCRRFFWRRGGMLLGWLYVLIGLFLLHFSAAAHLYPSMKTPSTGDGP